MKKIECLRLTGSVSLKSYLTYLSTNCLHSSYLMHILMSILTKWRLENSIWFFFIHVIWKRTCIFFLLAIYYLCGLFLLKINVLNGFDIFSLIPSQIFHNSLKIKKIFQYQWLVTEYKYELICKSIAKCTDLQIHKKNSSVTNKNH